MIICLYQEITFIYSRFTQKWSEGAYVRKCCIKIYAKYPEVDVSCALEGDKCPGLQECLEDKPIPHGFGVGLQPIAHYCVDHKEKVR